MHKKMKYSKRDPMAKGCFSQLSNCEQESFLFNLAPIYGIKTCQKKLLYTTIQKLSSPISGLKKMSPKNKKELDTYAIP